ncbi:hypothetical protein D3C72_1379230 [compost metagenome]
MQLAGNQVAAHYNSQGNEYIYCIIIDLLDHDRAYITNHDTKGNATQGFFDE